MSTSLDSPKGSPQKTQRNKSETWRYDKLRYIENPSANEIGNSVEEFLHWLGGPSCIVLTGQDNNSTRAVITLIHGNEPSGSMAIYRWIKSKKTPAVQIICIIASVNTALTSPLFHYRSLPDQPDLNRCFKATTNNKAERLAQGILACLDKYKPEAIIDIHNTSGSGPAFGVATHYSHAHANLVTLFCKKLMITHLSLGALMDITTEYVPAVTIEAGGRLDEQAHIHAWQGLVKFFTEDKVFFSGKIAEKNNNIKKMELFIEPVRIEINTSSSLIYASSPNKEFDITLKDDIEYLNFKPITPNQALGWVNRGQLKNFTIKDAKNQSSVNDWLRIKNHKLYPATHVILFMITNNPVIAIDDCLFYAVKYG